MKMLIIPADKSKPLQTQELQVDVGDRSELQQLQDLVGGWIESIPERPQLTEGVSGWTGYVNEEGKYLHGCVPNLRATDFMVPGVGLFPGDYIAGEFVLIGFDYTTGEHQDVPDAVVRRAELIAEEAGA